MAKDMVCKLCEAEPEQEVGIMLISDLTGSGQLPFAIGPRCIEAWLTEMLEIFALPEGIPPSEPSELEEEWEGDLIQPSQKLVEALEGFDDPMDAYLEDEAAVDPPEPSGPSPAESSAPSTGNGRRGARKLTDPVNIPTA
jgi:hypothetical protein